MTPKHIDEFTEEDLEFFIFSLKKDMLKEFIEAQTDLRDALIKDKGLTHESLDYLQRALIFGNIFSRLLFYYMNEEEKKHVELLIPETDRTLAELNNLLDEAAS